MRVRTHQRAEIDTNPKRIIVELQRHAAAIVEFKIQVIYWLEVDARFVAIVSDQIGAAGGDVRTREPAAVMRRTCGSANSRRAAAKNAANHGLVSPRRDVVGRRLQTERSLVVFQPARERRVVTEARKRPREIPRV